MESQKSLYEIVKSLQAAKGNLEKQAILIANKDNELFKQFMKATYDVSLNYYQSKIHKNAKPADKFGFEMDQKFLDWMKETLAERLYTGKAAVQGLMQMCSTLTPEGFELAQLLIKRSIGAGVGDTMVLKTWPDLYFIPPYMRCASMNPKILDFYKSKSEFYVEVKYDGSFAYLKPKAAITRQGSYYPKWFVAKIAHDIDSHVMMGEITVSQWNGDSFTPMTRKEGNGVLNSILQGGEEGEFSQYEFQYTVWDMIDESEFEAGKSDRPLKDRKFILESALECNGYPNIYLAFSKIVKSVAEANAIHIKETKAGREGTVWKTMEGVWRDTSSGTKDAVKNKVVFECEYEVLDWYEGEGKAAGMLGGVTIGTSCKKLINNVGSGFSDDQRKVLMQRAIDGTLIGSIFAVEANDIMDARGKDTVSLSLPVFIEERFDKKVADSLERVYEQFEAAKLGKVGV